jgi:hypothetical protein
VLTLVACVGLALVGCSDSNSGDHGRNLANLVTADGGDAGPPPDIFERVVPASGPPEAFVIAARAVLTEQEFLDRYAHDVWELTDKDEIRAGGAPLTNGKYVSQVYLQYYAGFPVAGGSVVLTSYNGHLDSGIGDFVAHVDRDLGDVELVDGHVKKMRVHHGEAKQLAFAEVERFLGLTTRVAVYEEPKGEIVLSGRRVAWRFVFSTKEPFAQRMVDIDADNGSVLKNTDLMFSVWQPMAVQAFGLDHDGDPGTPDNVLRILAEVESDTVAPNKPKTRLQYGPLKMGVFDDTTVPANLLMSQLVDYTSPDVGFRDPATDFPVTTMWAMESSAEYLNGLFGLDGLDGAGAGLNAHINVPVSGLGGVPSYSARYNAILIPTQSIQQRYDVLAHEVTHSVQTQLEGSVGVQPDPTTEKAALWESYADIFGMAVEEQITKSTVPDWTIGQPVIRNLEDPTTSPTGAQSVFYNDAVFRLGDQYVQAGVQTKWFHLVATGGTPPVPGVVGVGIETARRIAFGAMIYRKPATYLQAVEASLRQASQECGAYSQLWVSVNNAWYHVGAGTFGFYSEPGVSPANGATDVQPWPAKLSFSAFEREQVWEVEIDTVPTFDSADRRGPFILTVPEATGLLSAELNLRPGTTYFWRVRANLPEDTIKGCWRETHSFSTASMTPELVAPKSGSSLDPWEMEFEWNEPAAEGSLGTKLTIRADGHADYVQQVVPCTTQTGCKKTENLPVDKGFTWSLQQEGPTDLYSPNVGTLVQSENLHTNLPESEFVSLTGGPWPSTIAWKEVAGAVGYVAAIRTGFGDPIWNTDNSVETSAEVYLDPNFDHYELMLQPLGPDKVLGKTGMQERGRQTAEGFALPHEILITASVDILEPNRFDQECRLQGTHTDVTWTQIEGAEYYVVSVFEREVPWPSGNYSLCDVNTKVDEFQVPHIQGEATQTVGLPSYRGNFNTFLAVGYVVNVTGYSPGGRFDSWCGGSDNQGIACEPDTRCMFSGWFVQPEAPILTAPPNGAVLEDHETSLQWSYTLANGGSFYLETFDGHSCSDEPTVALTTQADSTSGAWGHGIKWGKPGWPASGENLEKSWRVRPTGIYAPCNQGPQWSPCRSLTVRASCGGRGESCCTQSDPCTGSLVCDGGTCDECGTEGKLCCGEPPATCVSGQGLECKSGRCSKRADLVPCGSPVVHSGNHIVPPARDIDLGARSGRFWFGFDTVNIPDKIEVFRSGQLIASTAQATNSNGCVGTTGGMIVDLDDGSPIVTVRVQPNCNLAHQGLTQWAYLVGCVAQSALPSAGQE